MKPTTWLAQYDEKLMKAAEQARKADNAIREAGGSATSRDGAVTVRVNASGALCDLVLRPGVGDVAPDDLAQVIMETTRRAHREVSAQVVAAMDEFVGPGQALDMIKAHLPEGYAGDENDRPPDVAPRRDIRPDDEYFENLPEVIK